MSTKKRNANWFYDNRNKRYKYDGPMDYRYNRIAMPVSHRWKRSFTSINSKPHKFKRNVTLDYFGLVGSGAKSYSFKLSMIPTWGEYTNLFDQYKVTGLAVKVYYGITGVDANGTTISNPGIVGMAFDYDDINHVGSWDELKEYATYKERSIVRCNPWTRYFVPKINNMIWRTSVSTGYSIPKYNPWINCTDKEVEFFGIKMWFESPPSVTNNVRIECTAYMLFKNTK